MPSRFFQFHMLLSLCSFLNFFFFPVIDTSGDHHAQVIMQHHPVEQVRYAVIRSRLQRIRWTFMLIFLCPLWIFLSLELDTVEHHAQVIMQHHSVVSKQVDIYYRVRFVWMLLEMIWWWRCNNRYGQSGVLIREKLCMNWTDIRNTRAISGLNGAMPRLKTSNQRRGLVYVRSSCKQQWF